MNDLSGGAKVLAVLMFAAVVAAAAYFSVVWWVTLFEGIFS